MNEFFNQLLTKDTFTENAMPTHSTSGSALVDMFFRMGGSRNLSRNDLAGIFTSAFFEDQLRAVKAIFYNRDIRGGQGERRSFRVFYRFLCENHPEIAIKNISNVPKYGRWDDLLVALYSPVETYVVEYIYGALASGNKLCAKWMPREGKSMDSVAKRLMELWNLSPRNYRKLLSGNTEVVETLMSNREWSQINYSHVPSVAMSKYRTAFYKHDGERFDDYLNAVEKGEEKINASAIFPHDLVAKYLSGYYWSNPPIDKAVELQWQNLPNYMPEGKMILPVCDVSGSMMGLPMEVCVSLGIYLSERNVGPFKDGFITFSNRPKLQLLTGTTLRDKVKQLSTADWAGSTNLEATFKLILDSAKRGNLSPEQLPDTLLILSDMQFNQCVSNHNDSAMEMIRRMYAEAGYTVPNIVFWNLRTSHGVPVKVNESGVALVSGFSPSIMKNVLSKDLNPLSVVYQTLDSERYSSVVV